MNLKIAAVSSCILVSMSAWAATEIIDLPAPAKNGGKPLAEVFAARRTVRKFKSDEISLQKLADLLWMSNGVSSVDGKRTAPSARNRQEIEIYCLLPSGAYFYNAAANKLEMISSKDLRSFASKRPAPCYLALVSNASKEASPHYGVMDTGYVSQNIYLACESLDLATCAMGMIGDKETLSRELKLGKSRLLLVHPVGISDEK